MKIQAYFDGSCGPKNPGGIASWGIVIYRDGEKVHVNHGKVGEGTGMTNNVAEASGLIAVLMWILEQKIEPAAIVEIFGDSNIVIRHMNRMRKKAPLGHYAPYVVTAQILAGYVRTRHRSLTFQWIPRERNAEADEQAAKSGCAWIPLYRMDKEQAC